MALRFKPHVAQVYQVDDADGPGTAVRGQLTPMTAAAALTAVGVELKRPHMWLGDAEDEPLFQEGGRLVMNGITYAIKAKQAFKDISIADHVQVFLEVFGAGS